jgi:RNA polymerase sigma factor (sigma-70 family)
MGTKRAPVAMPQHVAEAELDQLYRDEALGMTRLAFLMLGRRDIAEEIVHDAFLAVRPKLLAGELSRPGAYLRTSVVNGCRMWLRRRGIERRHQPAPPAPTDARDDEVALHLALRTLTTRQREAVVLRYFADLPETEIAGILRCRPATVRSLIHRGIAVLREELT